MIESFCRYNRQNVTVQPINLFWEWWFAVLQFNPCSYTIKRTDSERSNVIERPDRKRDRDADSECDRVPMEIPERKVGAIKRLIKEINRVNNEGDSKSCDRKSLSKSRFPVGAQVLD